MQSKCCNPGLLLSAITCNICDMGSLDFMGDVHYRNSVKLTCIVFYYGCTVKANGSLKT